MIVSELIAELVDEQPCAKQVVVHDHGLALLEGVPIRKTWIREDEDSPTVR